MIDAPYPLPNEMFWSDEDFYHDEYCNRPREVACQFCNAVETAPEEQLRKYGWLLDRKWQVCPRCLQYLQRVQAQAEVDRVQRKAA